MTSLLARQVSKRILGENNGNRYGKEDPYFEQVPATRLDGRPSKKTKKRRKALPPGISERDGKILTKARRRAYYLDYGFNFCGIKFGWSSIVGLVPAIGDFLEIFMAAMVFRTCCQIEGGLPSWIMFRMIINIIVDFGIGLVPILGDLADAFYRCNTLNVILLERHLRKTGKEALARQGVIEPRDPSCGEEFDRSNAEDVYDDPPPYRTAPSTRPPPSSRPGPRPGPSSRSAPNTRPGPSRPTPAMVRADTGQGRSFLGVGSRQAPPPDLESGGVRPSRRAR